MSVYIGVVGASNPTPRQLDLAGAVGRLLATHGAIVVCGGLGGVMEAVCRGAQEIGGVTVGILPTDDRSNANPFLTVALATGLGELRNGLVVRSADAIIAIGSGWGTLSEIALAQRTGVPVFTLDSWSVACDASGTKVEMGIPVQDPQEAVARAMESTRRPQQR